MKFKIPFTQKVIEIRSSLANPQQWLLNLLGGGLKSKSGIDVSASEALKISVVFACVKVISETVAFLNCNLYRRLERGKQKAENHDLYYLLHYLPNPETTSFDFWVMYIVNLLLTGDAFAYIKRDGNGKIIEIWNIPSKNVTIYRNSVSKELFYKVRDDQNNEFVYYPENIMHTRGMRFESNDSSLDPINCARDALGLGLALEEYGSKYFANGAQVGGIVEYTGVMSDESFSRFKDTFYNQYAGVINSNRVMFLEDGSKFTKITNNPDESQAIEARQFQVIEICRFFNVPPHKVMDLIRATFSNIEQQSIEFVQSCIGPMCVRLEQTIFKDLLSLSERKKYFAKFNINNLLRGDSTSRKDFYASMIQNGVFSPNDALELEDMNTYEGGDIHMVNGNMIPVDKIQMMFDSKYKGGDGDNAKGNSDLGTIGA